MADGKPKQILETERLILREFSSADAELVLEILNEPAFIRFVADRNVRTTRDAANYLTEKILPSYEQFGFGFYVVELKENGLPLGMCGSAGTGWYATSGVSGTGLITTAEPLPLICWDACASVML